MLNRGIYKNTDGTISIIVPSEEVLQTVGIKAIMEKDVPQDLPYWIVEDSIIPTDRTFREAWVVDESLGEPDGFGGESSEFTDEQLLSLYNAGVIQ